MTTPLSPIAVHKGSGDLTTTWSQNSTTCTLAKPANTADGDVLVAWVYGQLYPGSISSAPAGWNEAFDLTSKASRTGGVYLKPIPSAAAETATSYSWVFSQSTRFSAMIFRVTGANLNALLDVISSTAASYVTGGATVPQVTTTHDGDLILNFIFTNDSSQLAAPVFSDSYSNPDIGTVAVLTGNSSACDVFYYVQATAGTTPANDIITRDTAPVNGKVFSIALAADPSQTSLIAGWGSSTSMGATAAGNTTVQGAVAATSVSSMSTAAPNAPRTTPVAQLTNSGDFTWSTFGVTNAQSISGGKPANTQDGDLLLAVFISQQPLTTAGQEPSAADSAWVRANVSSPRVTSARPLAVFALPCTPGTAAGLPANWSFSTPGSTGRIGLLIFRVTNADLSAYFDAAPAAVSGGTPTSGPTQVAMTAISTTNPNDLVLALMHVVGTSAQGYPVFGSEPAGFAQLITEATNAATASFDYLQISGATQANPGSVSYTETFSAQSGASGWLLGISGKPAATYTGQGGWGSVSSLASSAKSTAPSMDAVSVSSLGVAPLATTAQTAVMASASSFVTLLLSPVQAFKRNLPMYISHRGGDSDWVQNTTVAYQNSVAWSRKLALEVSLIPTSDGFYMLSDQTTTNGVFNQNVDIRTQTKQWLKDNLRTTVGNFPPMFFDEDILPVYGGPNSTTPRVIFLDNKTSNNVTQMLNLLDSQGGPGYWILKGGGAPPNSFIIGGAQRGYECWGYWFPADTSAGKLNDSNVAPFTMLGLQYNDTDAQYTAATSYGKPILPHIIGSQSNLAAANAHPGVTPSGYMVSAIHEVVPADEALPMLSSSAFNPQGAVNTGNVASWGSSSSMSQDGVIAKPGALAATSVSALSLPGTRTTSAAVSMSSVSHYGPASGPISGGAAVAASSSTSFSIAAAVTRPLASTMASRTTFTAAGVRVTSPTPFTMTSISAMTAVGIRTVRTGAPMLSSTSFTAGLSGIVSNVSMTSRTSLSVATQRVSGATLGMTSVTAMTYTPGASTRREWLVMSSATAFAVAAPQAIVSVTFRMRSVSSFITTPQIALTAHWKSVILWDPDIPVVYVAGATMMSSSHATFYALPVSSVRPFPLTARLMSYATAPRLLRATLAPQPLASVGDY